MLVFSQDESGIASFIEVEDIRVSDIIARSDKYQRPKGLEDTNIVKLKNRYINDFNISREKKCDMAEILTYNKYLLKCFIEDKRLEGRSEETLDNYCRHILNLIFYLAKPIHDVTSKDIKDYLNNYKDTRGVKNLSLDDKRHVFNSFFNYLYEEDYIDNNPVKKIHKIKSEIIVKRPFTEEQIIHMKDYTSRTSLRNRALIDFLNSSGCRVSEVSRLNIEDIDLTERECVVYGKGAKERVVFFDAETKIHLGQYIKSRTDNHPALFIRIQNPPERLSKDGIEYVVREIGRNSGVTNAYPHRFRRSLATRLLQKGVPIEQVQILLGHTKIETTLLYAEINKDEIKRNHQKYA